LQKGIKAGGYEQKTCIGNDRGIHASAKHGLPGRKYANGATPQSTGIKGDHLVGDYYAANLKKTRKLKAN
jgi:arginyl-tRNA synthetase